MTRGQPLVLKIISATAANCSMNGARKDAEFRETPNVINPVRTVLSTIGGPINRRSVRRQRDFYEFFRAEILVLPDIPQLVRRALQSEIAPGVVQGLRRRIQIEQRHVNAIFGFGSRD